MSLSGDLRLLVEIAHMYYDEGAKQEEVARKFGISRSLVSKYLAKAREQGLVEIIVHDDQLHPFHHLEDAFRQRFPLREVICVPSDNLSGEKHLQKRLGAAAAKYLARMLKPDQVVAVAPGVTIHEMAMSFSTHIHMPSVTFVPLTGGMGTCHADIQANVACQIFAKRCGGKLVELHAPLVVDSPEAKAVFMRQAFIKDVFDLAKTADIGVMSIGGKPIYNEMTTAYPSALHPPTAIDSGAVVGDICYNFIQKDGTLLDCDWNRRLLALNLAEMRQIPLVVLVAGGRDKVLGIRAALAQNLIDVLITDEKTIGHFIG